VVDADLSDYFNTVPHGALMKSLSRRIADGQVLAVIARWLEAPVEEREADGRTVRSTPAKDAGRGTPQGGVISPLLANVYFRRFILAWKQLGYEQAFDSVTVNYADDFVMGSQHKGEATQFLTELRERFMKFNLSLHPEKTRLIEFGR
jgi:RNA-directed DNA polymerase